MREKIFYKITQFDTIVISFLVVLSVAAIAGNYFRIGPAKICPAKAVIYCDNKLVKKIDLAQYGVVDVPGRNAVKLMVSESGIRVMDTDCPQKVCMHTGFIRYDGQTIVCLPKRLVISIEAKAENAACDAVCY